MERVFKALAEPTRCRIVALLNEGCLPAGEISLRLRIPKPTLSAHLAVLRNAELVSIERNGTRIIYTLRRHFLQDSLIDFARGFEPAARKSGFANPPNAIHCSQHL
jgi:DNA-binding transcriptional ArsR family regulator